MINLSCTFNISKLKKKQKASNRQGKGIELKTKGDS